MIGHAHITMLATGNPAAVLTFNHRSKATAVLKQDYLLSGFERLAHLLYQDWREKCILHLFPPFQFTDIGQDHLGRRSSSVTNRQLNQTELTGHGVEIRIDRWSSRAQQYFASMHLCQNNSRIAGMITRRRILLFVSRLVFLINDN